MQLGTQGPGRKSSLPGVAAGRRRRDAYTAFHEECDAWDNAMGWIYKAGRRWWIGYYRAGRKFRESSRSGVRADAERLLRQREGDIAAGRPLGYYADRVTFEELTTDFIRDYEINGKRSLWKAKKSVERLTEIFSGWRAAKITTADIRGYIERRRQGGFSNGSINRELAALQRMFRLAVQAGRLHQVPHIPMLLEAAPRAGFFEARQFEDVLTHLPPTIRTVATLGYETGWRLREILGLQWRQVDLTKGSLRLDPGTTKNRDGRLAYLSPSSFATLKEQKTATEAVEHERGVIIPWIFHRHGKPIGSFRRSWLTACRKAGVPGMIFHDLRRTAVRNMVRAGVPERVAMQISGH